MEGLGYMIIGAGAGAGAGLLWGLTPADRWQQIYPPGDGADWRQVRPRPQVRPLLR